MMDVALLLKKYGNDINAVDLKMHFANLGFLKAWQVFVCILVDYLGFKPDEIPCYDSKYKKKAYRMMDLMFEDGKRRSSTDNLVAKNKILVLFKLCQTYKRTFLLFPVECCSFFGREIQNILTKYQKKFLKVELP